MVNKFHEGNAASPDSGLRYLYADPTIGTRNFGDHIINYATLRLLRENLGPPAGTYDPTTGRYPEGDYDLMVLPGVTMLTAGARSSLNALDRLPFPTYCLAGSIWSPLPRPGILLRNRVVAAASTGPIDLSVPKQLAGPIGARDSFTFSRLQEGGFETIYTGCPTLSLPAEDVADDGYVLFSVGRHGVRQQAWAAARMAARGERVVGIAHEPRDVQRLRAAGWRLPLVTFHGDVELYLSYFAHASAVVTGRLHGALPALAYGKPVYYFGTRDSRTTIFDDLGITIHSGRHLHKATKSATTGYSRSVVSWFAENWKLLFAAIRRQHCRQSSDLGKQQVLKDCDV